jgi:hypothetical protein
VDDDLVTLAAAHRLGTVREEALEDHGHRVGALVGPGRPIDVVRRDLRDRSLQRLQHQSADVCWQPRLQYE